MINRVLIVISVLLVSNSIFGQADFYFDFIGAYSFIPKFEHVDELIFADIFGNPSKVKITEEYKVKPGFTIEVGFDKNIKNRISINSGIGFLYYQFKRESKLEFVENNITFDIYSNVQPGNPIGDYYGTQPGGIRFQDINTDLGDDSTVIGNSNTGETKILYLAIPVRLNYTLVPDKLKIGVGLNNYFVAYSSQIKTTLDFETQPISQKEYNDKSSNGLNNYQLTGEITLEYMIFKGLWVKAGYINNFSTIYDKLQPTDYPTIKNDKAKYRTVLIGLKYII
ncbi:MAG: outer membrane beta-barrel protein [Bacteroidales bacterium]|nr:outer membrane beta-barrel protein [Bacteroidales bacterium]